MSNSTVSLTVSEAESDYCDAKELDPEEPVCGRVMLTGEVWLSLFPHWSGTYWNIYAYFFFSVYFMEQKQFFWEELEIESFWKRPRSQNKWRSWFVCSSSSSKIFASMSIWSSKVSQVHLTIHNSTTYSCPWERRDFWISEYMFYAIFTFAIERFRSWCQTFYYDKHETMGKIYK